MADINELLANEQKRVEFLQEYYNSNAGDEGLEDEQLAPLLMEITDTLGHDAITLEDIAKYGATDTQGKKADKLNFAEFFKKGTQLLTALKNRPVS